MRLQCWGELRRSSRPEGCGELSAVRNCLGSTTTDYSSTQSIVGHYITKSLLLSIFEGLKSTAIRALLGENFIIVFRRGVCGGNAFWLVPQIFRFVVHRLSDEPARYFNLIESEIVHLVIGLPRPAPLSTSSCPEGLPKDGRASSKLLPSCLVSRGIILSDAPKVVARTSLFVMTIVQKHLGLQPTISVSRSKPCFIDCNPWVHLKNCSMHSPSHPELHFWSQVRLRGNPGRLPVGRPEAGRPE
jgi:hypothetical protein